MSTILGKLHHFLWEHSFYPLMLSSVLAVSYFIWRVLYSGSFNYINLIWNLFLAWVPYVFSLLAAGVQIIRPKFWPVHLLLGLGWLAFFPNAPYLVTDFYHLGWRPPVPLWYDIGLTAIFAFTGCFLAVASLRTMQVLVESYFGKILGWIFTLTALGLAGLGVYLGWVERWNSWDLLLNPRSLIAGLAQQMLNPLENLGFVGFTLMFTSIMIVFYLMFVTHAGRERT
jgi:uncharacterized membrane protein